MKTDGIECVNFDCPFHDTLMEFSCSGSDRFEEPSIETCKSAIIESEEEIKKTVFLLTTGDGEDGNEWTVVGIYTTREKAEAIMDQKLRDDPWLQEGGYANPYNIEEWELDEE